MEDIVLDDSLLTGYLNNLGKVTVSKMLELYMQQSELYLADIGKALESSSQSLWQEHCHKMKGAAGSVGLKALHIFLVNIEKSVAPRAEKKVMLANLTTLNAQGVRCFKHWLVVASGEK